LRDEDAHTRLILRVFDRGELAWEHVIGFDSGWRVFALDAAGDLSELGSGSVRPAGHRGRFLFVSGTAVGQLYFVPSVGFAVYERGRPYSDPLFTTVASQFLATFQRPAKPEQE